MNFTVGEIVVCVEQCFGQRKWDSWDMFIIREGDRGVLVAEDTVEFKGKGVIRLNKNRFRPLTPLEKAMR